MTSSPNTAPKVSVCIAAYNGSQWITEQLNSILAEIGVADEVIVVDDKSTDDTVAVVTKLHDPRIRIFRHNTNKGYVQTFGTAIGLARGKYLLLSDQDDIWVPGRVTEMVAALDAGADVVVTNLATLGGPDYVSGPYGQTDWRIDSRDSRKRIRNLFLTLIGAMSYWGCAMGIRREIVDTILPFPEYLTESHDLWIAIYGNLARRITHLDTRSVWWRNHDSNTNPKKPRGPVQLLRKRWMMLRAMVTIWLRIHSRRRTIQA